MSTNEYRRLEGKVAFGSGIGRGTAIAFAREGASVLAVDRTETHSGSAVEAIERGGGRAIAVGCDVADSREVEAAVRRAVDSFGRIDLAVNNSGVAQPPAPVADISDEEVGSRPRHEFAGRSCACATRSP
jgi:NAD(P)-dependent dehydrogenase (short-subunit alcohol dehydrogenase family)